MRLIRVGAPGAEVPAVLADDGTRYDVSTITADFDAAFFAADGIADLRARWGAGDIARLPELDPIARLGSPIARPGNVVCAGLNYADHARESGMPIPEEPVLFNKAPNTVVGPYDDIRVPRGATKLDYEVELGVVIGAECRYLSSPEEAWSRVAGYVLCNDVSERSFQIERGGQWTKGKSAETFNPCGPWLVTPDEFDPRREVSLWLDVNGLPRQRGNTREMIFGVDVLLHYISQFMVMDPGDLLDTGTPPGVAMGMTEPAWLAEGDVVTLGIDGLGDQCSTCVPAP